MTRGPKNWSKTPPTIRRHAPRLGENTVEILTEIGYSAQDARKIAGETGEGGQAGDGGA
jgi:crotonobetainyl-CoA:carnitine CoA-transferase CaiB-like acyl-CoA transferase